MAPQQSQHQKHPLAFPLTWLVVEASCRVREVHSPLHSSSWCWVKPQCVLTVHLHHTTDQGQNSPFCKGKGCISVVFILNSSIKRALQKQFFFQMTNTKHSMQVGPSYPLGFCSRNPHGLISLWVIKPTYFAHTHQQTRLELCFAPKVKSTHNVKSTVVVAAGSYARGKGPDETSRSQKSLAGCIPGTGRIGLNGTQWHNCPCSNRNTIN